MELEVSRKPEEVSRMSKEVFETELGNLRLIFEIFGNFKQLQVTFWLFVAIFGNY